VSTLEADLSSYRSLQSSHTSEDERVMTLKRSVSSHEVAMATLQSDYDKQALELTQAEQEVGKLRSALAKKVSHKNIIVWIIIIGFMLHCRKSSCLSYPQHKSITPGIYLMHSCAATIFNNYVT